MLDLKDRKVRLANICKRLPVSIDYPLLKGILAPNSQIKQLKKAVHYYLLESLQGSGAFLDNSETEDDFFERHSAEIAKLPNVTPNGLILPKKENFLSFNLVQKITSQIFGSLHLDEHIDKIHYPINIRIVSPHKEPSSFARPRSSTKIHSDIWAAEPANGILMFIPLFGDMNTSIDFFEPATFPEELVKPLNDFSEAAWMEKNSKKYDLSLRVGEMYITDSFLLHRTALGNRPRLSIDFRFLAKDIIPSDLYLDTPRAENYLPMHSWNEIGTNFLAHTHNSLRDPIIPDNTKNAYAAQLSLINL